VQQFQNLPLLLCHFDVLLRDSNFALIQESHCCVHVAEMQGQVVKLNLLVDQFCKTHSHICIDFEKLILEVATSQQIVVVSVTINSCCV